MNWAIMQLTCDRSSPFGSSALSTPIFTLIGKYFFWSCYTNLVSKSRYKNKTKVLLSRFRGYLGDIESDCRTVWTYIFVCIITVRVTTTSRVCWYLAERRWLPSLRVCKISIWLFRNVRGEGFEGSSDVRMARGKICFRLPFCRQEAVKARQKAGTANQNSRDLM